MNVENLWTNASGSARQVVRSALVQLSEYADDLPPDHDVPVKVIVPSSDPDHLFRDPIFNPMHALHKALSLLAPEPYQFHDSVDDLVTTGALVLVNDHKKKSFTPLISDNWVSLYEVRSVSSIIWKGPDIGEAWTGEKGIKFSAQDQTLSDSQLMMEVVDMEFNGLESPPIMVDGPTLNLLILSYVTPILTEGFVEWRDDGDAKEKAVKSQLIFNDPASRTQPRRVLILQLKEGKTRYSIRPIMSQGLVDWRQIEIRQLGLTLISSSGPAESHLLPRPPVP